MTNLMQASLASSRLAHNATRQLLEAQFRLLPQNTNTMTSIRQPRSDVATRDFEFEINDDLLRFYEDSLRFKREKKQQEKKRLKQLASGELVEHVSGEQVQLDKSSGSSSAPREQSGLARQQELAVLYGTSVSVRIHLVETDLQMRFDANLDRYQPTYWPSFPLKMIFS